MPRFFDTSLISTQESLQNFYKVSVDPGDLPVSREAPETISIAQMIELRELLEMQEFNALNEALYEFQKLFEENPLNEYKIYDAYRVFEILDLYFAELIGRWKEQTPDAYQPYLAAGVCYYALGWKERGTKYIADTTEEQIEGLRKYLSEAEKNVNVCMKMNPNLLPAHDLLISIYNSHGPDRIEKELIQTALERFPQSYLIRNTACWALEPRWGGSYEQMEEIAKSAVPHYNSNPRLTALYGKIYLYQGDYMSRLKNFEEAIELFNRAIEFGDDWNFYYRRARTYHFTFKKYDRALDDINKSIAIRPTRSKNYIMRSKIYLAMENYDESLSDLAIGNQLTPESDRVEDWAQRASNELLRKGHLIFKTDLSAAIDFYNLSLQFYQSNDEVYYWRGVALHRLQNKEDAMLDFTQCIEINPRHFESYRMIDYLLAEKGQWDMIIAYWTVFLEHEPDEARAYLERAGAHKRKGDREAAIADLMSSCDLGLEEACKILDRIQ